MDYKRLLNCNFNCKCGQKHHIPIEAFSYSENISEKIFQFAQKRNINKISIVSDERTLEISAGDIKNELTSNKFIVSDIIINDKNGQQPQCDDLTCNWLKEKLNQAEPELVIAVGSGTINDLCKWASFEMKLPYLVAATAASMNGYASANVAAKIDKVKVIVRANCPLAVFAEPHIIENAPSEMTAAGFADTIAKFQSTADWKINNLLFDEYYCQYCADILKGLQNKYLDKPEKIQRGDADTVKALFEALFLTGAAMTMIGTSTPASGGEHLLSHTLDMTANINNNIHWLHGLQVGLGTIISAVLYQKIIAIDTPKIFDMPTEIDCSYWQNDLLIKSVQRQYQAKLKYLPQIKKKLTASEIFNEIKNRALQKTKTPCQIKSWLKKADAAQSYRDLGCPPERLKQAMLHMHEIRSRFTVVDLAWLCGILPDATDEIIDTWLSD